jgi:hypothetical protein
VALKAPVEAAAPMKWRRSMAMAFLECEERCASRSAPRDLCRRGTASQG